MKQFEYAKRKGPTPKWCSGACANRAYRRRKKPSMDQARPCDSCGKSYVPVNESLHCTEACMKKDYYARNRKGLDSYRGVWSRVNRKKQQAYVARARAKRPEYYRERRRFYQNRRRIRLMNGTGSHSFEQWMSLVAFYNNRCVCCGRLVRQLTVDHVVPVALGGTDSIDNIQPLCFRCNRMKQRIIMDFRLILPPFVLEDLALILLVT